MRSELFGSGAYREVEQRVSKTLNDHPDFLSPSTARSPRAVGDAIETVLAESFEAILGRHCAEYSTGFARRAMADLAFKDSGGLYYVVDVKTHCADTRFNMPNLTSVERLARFYEDDSNYFVVLLVRYRVEGVRAVVSDVKFAPIEYLGWDCLTIGALGWGQIQIANSNFVTVNHGYSRKAWMLEFCDVMIEFYPKEIAKIGDRLAHFEKVRQRWAIRSDG